MTGDRGREGPERSDTAALGAELALASSDPSSGDYDVHLLRSTEFPWTTDTIYLNNASIGPLPERTRLALDRFNRGRSAPHLLPDRELFAILADTRRKIARLVGATAEEIALAVNTGFGLSMAARSLPLESGDVVLVSDKEFPANVYPWMRLADRGVTMELVPTTPEGWPDEPRLLERLRDPRVRVLAVSLVQFSSGYLVDLPRLSDAARAAGVFLVVDAIQGVGHVPLDLSRTPVDLLACGGQKWLLSPWGSGFIYVRRELIPSLDPVVTGWLAFEGTDDLSRLTRYDSTLRTDARRFELMTLPYQDFAGMNSSLDLLLFLGIERIRDHVRRLHEPVLAWAERSGARVVSPGAPNASGILCVAPDRVQEVHRRLKAARVICSLREGAIRFSPHCYNTVDEMDRVAGVLAGG
ncbi:MAG TPA: aminotransferase class V-fold PLP-dependent enzyme [Gemmatimonadales bacterium]|nr:aminotransferase class V-fold PLP-dependent enzyme [Gemmatimonadales bacterium]